MKVICWNVNSVKSRLEHLLKLLKEESPDIVMLQELKCEADKFPFMEVEELGYNIELVGQKTYNGVALLSKAPLEDVEKHLPAYDIDDVDEQARFIEAITTIEGKVWRFISVYVPNGGEVGSDKFQYKLKFYERLNKHLEILKTYDENIVIGGDFNVANDDIDIYAPKELENSTCCTLTEKKALRKIINQNFFDSFRTQNPSTTQYSWWDYRGGAYQHNKGLRIDYLFSNAKALDNLQKTDHLESYRKLDKPSDHIPVVAEFA